MGTPRQVVAEVTLPSGHRVQLVHGDLTEEEADALVNAANAYLKHGGGVAGALARKGGPQIQMESDEWVRRHGPVPVGGVAITGAGHLNARAILHAVGPVWAGGTQGEDQLLAEAIRNVLKTARAQGYERIAMPAISTGIFGFPKDRAAPIFWETIAAFAAAHPGEPPREIRVVILDEATLRPFQAAFRERFGEAPDEGGRGEAPRIS
ncbi:macro domain-containing protein [Thermoflexus sp.]|uniref:macro domain-containing protein n=1 Tax=Thermoflexus sp. TaxID=1969742 RepID=UPI0025FE5306|nr:macro domain-containing protein [Thermoflexus sp.]MCS6963016.1 macro domain-containing protein [Thermoflexus sp.]MCX7689584.1 macro domain-containing protein [Thermoflexus sp.]MDW8065700.1 macro domain-containing protein [Anaerolineae bacterium]MDW8185351.1 macro domain-containing protein [Anaerolineae bacterium]